MSVVKRWMECCFPEIYNEVWELFHCPMYNWNRLTNAPCKVVKTNLAVPVHTHITASKNIYLWPNQSDKLSSNKNNHSAAYAYLKQPTTLIRSSSIY